MRERYKDKQQVRKLKMRAIERKIKKIKMRRKKKRFK